MHRAFNIDFNISLCLCWNAYNMVGTQMYFWHCQIFYANIFENLCSLIIHTVTNHIQYFVYLAVIMFRGGWKTFQTCWQCWHQTNLSRRAVDAHLMDPWTSDWANVWNYIWDWDETRIVAGKKVILYLHAENTTTCILISVFMPSSRGRGLTFRLCGDVSRIADDTLLHTLLLRSPSSRLVLFQTSSLY